MSNADEFPKALSNAVFGAMLYSINGLFVMSISLGWKLGWLLNKYSHI